MLCSYPLKLELPKASILEQLVFLFVTIFLYFLLLSFRFLTLIWVCSLGVRFKVGGGGGVKLPAVKKLLEFCYKLEIWYVSTHTYVVSEDIPSSTKGLLIFADVSIFQQKTSIF